MAGIMFSITIINLLFRSEGWEYDIVGSQIAAHTLMETGNGPNEPNTINL